MGSGVSTQPLGEFPEPFFLVTYLPPKVKGLVYSETHSVYTNDLARAKSLPPPLPPPTRKHEIFHSEAWAEVDERTDEFRDTDLHRPINELVHQLTDCYDNDLSKVRALYRWCTSQPIVTSDYEKSNYRSTMYQLWNLKNGRISYAFLLNILCWLADIPCVIISGFIKGSTYEVAQKMSRDSHVGEWNAVLIGDHWRLIDTFWGARTLPGNTIEELDSCSYVSDESYFLTDPGQFIYSHFPDEKVWQLLAEDERTLEDFESMAVLNDRFFIFKMGLLSHLSSTIESEDGAVSISFHLHPSESLNQTFLCIPSFMSDKHADLDQDALISNDIVQVAVVNTIGEGRELSVNVRFPVSGVYRLDIIGKDDSKTIPGYTFDWVVVYKVIVNSVPSTDNVKDQVPANDNVKDHAPATDNSKDTNRELELVKIENCTNLAELGLLALGHPYGVTEMKPGDLPLRFRITDSRKFCNAQVSAKLLTVKPNVAEGPRPSSVGASPFVRIGDILKTAIQINEGQFEIRIVYRTATGQEIVICTHDVVCVLPPMQKEIVEHKKLERHEAKSTGSAISNDLPLETKLTVDRRRNATKPSSVEKTERKPLAELVERPPEKEPLINKDEAMLGETLIVRSQPKGKSVSTSEALVAEVKQIHQTELNVTSTSIAKSETSHVTKPEIVSELKVRSKPTLNEVGKKPEKTLKLPSEANQQEIEKAKHKPGHLQTPTPDAKPKPVSKTKVKSVTKENVKQSPRQETQAAKPKCVTKPEKKVKEISKPKTKLRHVDKRDIVVIPVPKPDVTSVTKATETAVAKPVGTPIVKRDIKVEQKTTAIEQRRKETTAPKFETKAAIMYAMPHANVEEGKQTQPKDDLGTLRKRLVAALDTQHISQLYRVVKETATAGHMDELEPEFAKAKEVLIQLRRLHAATKRVLEMNQRTIAEIKSYTHPIPEIHRVMQATLLLLGHTEEETEKWSDVRNLIGKTGKMSLKRRIGDFRVRDIDRQAVERSKSVLAGLKHEDLEQYSVGVAIFYAWSMEVSEGADSRKIRNS